MNLRFWSDVTIIDFVNATMPLRLYHPKTDFYVFLMLNSAF